jgi:hypothetical protein
LSRHKPTDKRKRATLAAIDTAALQSLLPPQYRLEFNEEARIMNILRVDAPQLLAQPQFTENEWCVLLVLFASYPHYAPYETLLSCLTLLPVAECRKRIQQAQQAGSQALSRELKPVYRALSGVRAKLDDAAPYLKISFIRDTGYSLIFSETNNVLTTQ